MNTNLTDLFNLKNLLNTNSDQIDQSSNAQSISKKKQAAKAAPTKADVTPVPRARVPILQLYVKTDSESNKPRLALADNNEHNADESKFYPLVSSSSVIMDHKKWCEAIELYKTIISAYGSYILTSEQINSITTQLDKYLANEKAGGEPQNIFCVIDLINYMLSQAFATLSFVTSSAVSTFNIQSIVLNASAWDTATKTQTITLTGIVADETKQIIHVSPSTASADNMNLYYDSGIMAIGQSTNSLTFKANKIPTANITVLVSCAAQVTLNEEDNT